MNDIQILTLDKIGKALGIDPNSGNLNIQLSNSPKNVLEFDENNNLLVRGIFIENIPDHNNIVWTDIVITDANVLAGMSDSSNRLQVGKDLLGNIWMRGAITNIGGTLSANSVIGKIPDDYHIAGYSDTPGFCQLAAIQSTLAGNTTALYLRLQNYYGEQNFAFSGNFATNVSFIMPPTIIGKAKYIFKGVFPENIPVYTDVTWARIDITNANIVSGMPDMSNPLEIGKDPQGNIWVRGAVTNVASAVAANGIIGTIPLDYHLSGYVSATGLCQLVPIQSTLVGNTTALFLRLKNYNGVQNLAFSGSLASGVTFMLQPTIVGRAKL